MLGGNIVDDMNENQGVINFIMLARIYDMMMLVADGLGKGKEAVELHQLHGKGQLMSPWPSLVPTDSEETPLSGEQPQEN
jgi:hypothetical protein